MVKIIAKHRRGVNKVLVQIRDSKGKRKSKAMTVEGLTPMQAVAIVRRAFESGSNPSGTCAAACGPTADGSTTTDDEHQAKSENGRQAARAEREARSAGKRAPAAS